MNLRTLFSLLVCSLLSCVVAVAENMPVSFDEFFNSVSFPAVRISPDGHSVVFVTDRADWQQSIFREELWLYRDGGTGNGSLVQLTGSGSDSNPEWSPDGRWIAFLSERSTSAGKEDGDAKGDTEKSTQLYLISPDGGEAFSVTEGEDVHAFTWGPDSRALYFSTRMPWTKSQKDSYKKNWKDVIEFRASERGDEIFTLTLADALNHRSTKPAAPEKEAAEAETGSTSYAHSVARSSQRVSEIAVSPDGAKLAFLTESISERQESVGEFEIYTVDLTQSDAARTAHPVTHNEAIESHIEWANDSRHLFFEVQLGSVEGKYLDTQPRVYWVDVVTGAIERWAGRFEGAIDSYGVTGAGMLATARLGTQVQFYSQTAAASSFQPIPGWAGTYEKVSPSRNSSRVAFVHSMLQKPAEIYLAESPEKLREARPITAFNQLFNERVLPQGKSFRWRSDDGTGVEGMLIYPPGKFEAKNLPVLTLIHGGPADADGDHFENDWYQWATLAANQGWLVFEPNYRGSTGYGDKFLMGIVPEMVSRPGKDILAGLDALVKEGIANPDRLAIGGYSYGGYMTNWLITQTTRFKAAMTGAGAVEHIGDWGNDDTTSDDAYFLGGLPWEAPQRYHDEAAIFQINKVRTPTHMVAGGNDIRVAVLEDYLLDRALHQLGVPSTLLIFPGEGHGLGKNPWHGKIKVREELKWLEKYGGKN